MTRSAIVPTILALCAAGSAAALDHEFAHAPLVVGSAATMETPEYFAGIDGSFKSKVTDDYVVVADDSALYLAGQARAYGLGIALETDWAVGQSTDYSRPGNRNNPGELLRTEVKIDWVLEMRDPRDANIPLLQIIPHFNYITYPNQAPIGDSYLKYRQRWLGVDAWWALPVEGVELGGGVEYNVSEAFRAKRGGIGARELLHYNAVELSGWQLVNLASADYRNLIGGADSVGVTTAVLGGRATVPMFVADVYGFVELEGSYWLSKTIRENFAAAGMDSGNVVLSVGLNWMPK
jgi:hypothetical protein